MKCSFLYEFKNILVFFADIQKQDFMTCAGGLQMLPILRKADITTSFGHIKRLCFNTDKFAQIYLLLNLRVPKLGKIKTHISLFRPSGFFNHLVSIAKQHRKAEQRHAFQPVSKARTNRFYMFRFVRILSIYLTVVYVLQYPLFQFVSPILYYDFICLCFVFVFYLEGEFVFGVFVSAVC